jgi:hypothetical protein
MARFAAGKAPTLALRFARSLASSLRPTGMPRMKLQATVTTAFLPAALAAASISLALLLLPGAAVPAHSSGLAPALKSVAGNVVAAVEAPVHTVTRVAHQQRKSIVSPSARNATTAVGRTSHAPSVVKHTPPERKGRVAHRHVLRTPAPSTSHGRGKAGALGHLKKAAPQAAHPAIQAGQSARGGHGKALGHSADVPHGPPAVPPGQAKKAVPGADGHAAAHSRGGAR